VSLPPDVFDAHALLKMTLAQYGLDSQRLIDWALEMLIAGKPIQTILLELEQQPEYKAAFPEIEARREKAKQEGIQYEPLSPAQILEYRTQAKALMRSFGVPADIFSTNADFFDLIVGNVSLAELQSRLDLAEKRVRHAPPEIRDAFAGIFGSGFAADEALFTYMIDADNALPRLEEMVRTAEASGAGARFGFRDSLPAAQRLAQQNLTYDQYAEGFSELDRVRALFDETLYESDWTWQDQGIAAAFDLEGGAKEALQRRGLSRAAETQGRGRAGEVERGVIGLGTAGRL
jgi:hypothetical protein